jgi:hypothetical protein
VLRAYTIARPVQLRLVIQVKRADSATRARSGAHRIRLLSRDNNSHYPDSLVPAPIQPLLGREVFVERLLDRQGPFRIVTGSTVGNSNRARILRRDGDESVRKLLDLR